MRVVELELAGARLVELDVFRDARGFFVERFSEARFAEAGLPTRFVQDNHSRSAPRVLRGLHFQDAPPQGKLVGVTSGAIWDVLVDVRAGSPTFGRWCAHELTGDNGRLLWIPPGLAHGFCVLGDAPADVVYKVDAPWGRGGEGGVRWDDPALAIPWPVREPLLSERDAALPPLSALARG